MKTARGITGGVRGAGSKLTLETRGWTNRCQASQTGWYVPEMRPSSPVLGTRTEPLVYHVSATHSYHHA